MPAQTLAAAAALVAFAVNGNKVELRLNEGSAEIVWITDSTFRLRHSLSGPLPQVKVPSKEKVDVDVEETPTSVTFSSKFLRVAVTRRGLMLRVNKADGTSLLNDLTPAQPHSRGVAWERAAHPALRTYGLGPRTDTSYELRGKRIETAIPMLVTYGGYGEYHASPGSYTFDMMRDKPDRYRIEAPAVDYYFFYGPGIKEIFDEATITREAVRPTPLPEPRTGSWDSLRDQIRRMAQASMSAVLMPAFDMTPYLNAPAPLAERARQIGQVTAGLIPEAAALTPLRQQLVAFFATYGEEAVGRGFPFFHPLPFQFPEDAEGSKSADEFMLGDEMLVAPIYTPSGERSVYLPRGIWTNMATNTTHRGRQTIQVKQNSLPIFARNGTIVPLNGIGAGDPMLLHYFPSLGAEFFLLETEIGEWSQVHAAPAADIMRLEIESKVDRNYEWVVHHAEKPTRVEFEARKYEEVGSRGALRDGAWYYDAGAKNLHIRAAAAKGSDVIVNIITPE